MNKKIIFVVAFIILIIGAWYLLTNNSSVEEKVVVSNPMNATYIIDGEPYTLVDGNSEVESAPGSSSKTITKYFGNEVSVDLNNDGREDSVFLLTQSTSGTGTFFYVASAINKETGWEGSNALLLGDRIAPQTTELSTNPSHSNVIVVNYLDRKENESMTEIPSVGKSIWLKFDTDSMAFGEVVQNFEGEADSNVMTLEMKKWQWVETTYNNDTKFTPKSPEDFTLTFNSDGTFSATTDCNLINGSYEKIDKNLKFADNMAMTRKFCEGSQEQDFVSLLTEVQSFFFTNKGELVFDLKLDTGSAIFK